MDKLVWLLNPAPTCMKNHFHIPGFEPIKFLVKSQPNKRETLEELFKRLNTPAEPLPLPRWMNRRVSRQRPKLPRLKRKERLNWHEWFADWYSALHKLGFQCRNEGINPTRKKINAAEVQKIAVLYMQKGDQGVALYSSVKALPFRSARFGWVGVGTYAKTIHRIVQGRRRDPSRGVARLDGSKASGIIPKYDLDHLARFFVDFDGALFEQGQDGVWEETNDIHAGGIYGEYLNNSDHYKSIRPYFKRAKGDCPTILDIQFEDEISGFGTKSDFKPITRLL